MKELRILIPDKIWEKLEIVEKKYGVSKETVVMRAIVKVLEEVGV